MKRFFLYFIIILSGYVLVWLAYYPGLWNYDPAQVKQVLSSSYNKLHPFFHTFLLGYCYLFGINNNNPAIGVILYDWIQMSIMASSFAYICCYISSKVTNKLVVMGIILYYGFFPVNSILSISSTKDVIFGVAVGLFWLFFVRSLEYDEINSNGKNCQIKQVLLIISGIIMILFRSNCIYAFLLFLFIFLIYSAKRKKLFKYVKTITCLLLSLIIAFSVDLVMSKVLHAKPAMKGVYYTITSQQMGRIYSLYDDEEIKNEIQKYYKKEPIEYKQAISDPMIYSIKDLAKGKEKKEYLELSLNLLKKYPMDSIDSFLILTKGGWDPLDISHSEIYGKGLERRQGYLLTDIKDGWGIVLNSKIPKLELIYEKLFSENKYQKIPGVNILFAPATYIWIFIILSFILFKQRKKALYGNLFLLCLYLTILLGPCMIIRYFYPFVVVLPLAFAYVIMEP